MRRALELLPVLVAAVGLALAAYAFAGRRLLPGRDESVFVLRTRSPAAAGSPSGARLAAAVTRRLRVDELPADVEAVDSDTVRVRSSRRRSGSIYDTLTWTGGITLYRVTPACLPDAPTQPAAHGTHGAPPLHEHEVPPAAAFEGKRDDVARTIMRLPHREGCGVLLEPTTYGRARAVPVTLPPLLEVPVDAATVPQPSGHGFALPLDATSEDALPRLREAVGDAPVAVAVQTEVVGTGPLSTFVRADARPSVRLEFGDDVAGYARAWLTAQVLRAPLPALRVQSYNTEPDDEALWAWAVALPFLVSLGWLLALRSFSAARPLPLWLPLMALWFGALGGQLVASSISLRTHGSALLDPEVAPMDHSLRGLPTALLAYVVSVGLAEEAAKLLAVLALTFRRRAIATPLDGLLVGGAVGLGFAAHENLGYLGESARLAAARVLVRALRPVVFHMVTGMLYGYALRAPRASRRNVLWLWLATVAFHGTLDTLHSIDGLDPYATLLYAASVTVAAVLLARAFRVDGAPTAARFTLGTRGASAALAVAWCALVLGTESYWGPRQLEARWLHAAPVASAGALLALTWLLTAALAFCYPRVVAVGDDGVRFAGAALAWDAVRAVVHRGGSVVLETDEAPFRIGPSPSANDLARVAEALRERHEAALSDEARAA